MLTKERLSLHFNHRSLPFDHRSLSLSKGLLSERLDEKVASTGSATELKKLTRFQPTHTIAVDTLP
jgi:hypothetical protein